MNLQDLVDRVRALSGIRLQSLRSDEQIEQVVNESYQEVLGLYPWPFLRGEQTVSLTAEQGVFTTPSTFRYLTGVTVTMDGKQTRLSQTTLDEIDAYEKEPGEPSTYARLTDREIRLHPAPKDPATVLLRGQLEFEPLVGTAEPLFAQQFHPIVAYRAAARVLSEEGDDSGRTESYQLDAGGYLQRMEKFYMASGDIGLIRIGSRRHH